MPRNSNAGSQATCASELEVGSRFLAEQAGATLEVAEGRGSEEVNPVPVRTFGDWVCGHQGRKALPGPTTTTILRSLPAVAGRSAPGALSAR